VGEHRSSDLRSLLVVVLFVHTLTSVSQGTVENPKEKDSIEQRSLRFGACFFDLGLHFFVCFFFFFFCQGTHPPPPLMPNTRPGTGRDEKSFLDVVVLSPDSASSLYFLTLSCVTYEAGVS
jgi:hypothetical protein